MTGRIVVVGAGRAGLALADALARRLAPGRVAVRGRSLAPPPHPVFTELEVAYESMRPFESEGWPRAPRDTSALVLAVADPVLPAVAEWIAQQESARDGASALHLAGAFGVRPLAPLRAAGFSLAAMHPLRALSSGLHGPDTFREVAFALTGEEAALTVARALVATLEGRVLQIGEEERVVYHAAAVIAANYLVALAGTASRLLTDVGVSAENAVPALLPLMRGTLENIERTGVSAALTGPIARGDAATVRLHLSRLSAADRELYSALGREALRIALDGGLGPEAAEEIGTLLAR